MSQDDPTPKRPPRNVEARSLAERLAVQGHKCKIPSTHDRLNETHHWWHEMARNYHEPNPFRYALGAFIQAGRNVTFVLQKEKAAFADFSWYREWAKQARKEPVLRWLHDARTEFVHQQALAPSSRLEVRCIGNPRAHADDEEEEDGPLGGDVSPFECTHYYMSRVPFTDHGHEFIRHWEIENLPGRELLDACRDVYDRLDALVAYAHERAGAGMTKWWGQNSGPPGRALPCMADTLPYRRARTVVREGREVWEDEPSGLHEGPR